LININKDVWGLGLHIYILKGTDFDKEYTNFKYSFNIDLQIACIFLEFNKKFYEKE